MERLRNDREGGLYLGTWVLRGLMFLSFLRTNLGWNDPSEAREAASARPGSGAFQTGTISTPKSPATAAVLRAMFEGRAESGVPPKIVSAQMPILH